MVWILRVNGIFFRTGICYMRRAKLRTVKTITTNLFYPHSRGWDPSVESGSRNAIKQYELLLIISQGSGNPVSANLAT
jgi:hypothetical protein